MEQMKPFLSVCMIVKNEEKVLRRCLESICGIADEIIIADTGSTDKTKEIALEYTDQVFEYEWENDFSKARNFAASKAKGEWILAIDADEFVDRDSFLKFKEELRNNPPEYNILAVQVVNFVGENGKDTILNYHERLYKNDGSISYYRSIHELLVHKDSKEKKGFANLQIYHSGYMKNVIEVKGKSKRNLNLLLSKKIKEPIDYYFLGNEYESLGELDKAIKYYKKGFQLKENLYQDWVIKLLIRLVNTLYRANRSEEALEIIETCEKLFPNLVDFKFFRGKICFDKGDFKKSKKIFEEILNKSKSFKADTSNDFLQYLPLKFLGEIYETENEYHLAVQYYSRALALNDADDYLWMKLITLLAEHSPFEELVEFIINNLLNRGSITHKRVIKILLGVPNLHVQKLTSSFLEDPNLSKIERESLLIKTLLLDKDTDSIISILNEKSTSEIISIIAEGIFSFIDLIILALEIENHQYRKLLFEIPFEKELKNLLNLLFNKNHKKLNNYEEELFLKILQQAEVLKIEKVIKKMQSKIKYLSPKMQVKVKRMRKQLH